MTISVVISTRNRKESLMRTIASVKRLATEIVVVDNESEDGSAAAAKKAGAVVFARKNNLMLNVNKNFGFSKASGDWILSLDDDEELTPELSRRIRDAVDAGDGDAVGYWIPRKNMIFGKWIRHGIWWPDRQLRLFKKGRGSFAERHVHEYLSVDGKTDVIDEPYIHHNYDSVSQYLDKMQKVYTESEVQKYVSSGYRVVWSDALRFPMSDFVKLYFAERGYRDGLHGLVLAILQAFYSFVIFVKLWERERFTETDIPLSSSVKELAGVRHDVTYWIRTARMRESRNPFVRLRERLFRRIGL